MKSIGLIKNLQPQQPQRHSQDLPQQIPAPQQSKPTTPSLSPINVVRNKRANQANWEKHQSRKNSVAGSESGLGGVIAGLENCASQGKFSKNMIRFRTKKIQCIINGLVGDKHGFKSKG